MKTHAPHGAFSWTELMTRDPASALGFYGALFGWTSETLSIQQGAFHVIKSAGQPIGRILQMPPQTAAAGKPSAWGCHVTVDSVDACAEKAVALGGQVLHPPTDIAGVGRFAVIADPQGAWVSVMSYALPAS